jgi:hypothetical protein
MIWALLIQIPISVVNSFAFVFGRTDTLPAVGGFDIDAFLIGGVSGFRALVHFLPPLGLGMEITVSWIVFVVGLRIIRMIPVIGKITPQD